MLKLSSLSVGNTVRVVPLGLKCSVSYNDNGVISGVEVDTEVKSLSDFCVRLQKAGIVPSRVGRKASTTVVGVLYIKGMKATDVVKSKNDVSDYVRDVVESGDVESVKYEAYLVEADNVRKNPYQQTTVMRTLGFDPCPSFVVGPDTHDRMISKYLVTMGYPFVGGYVVVDGSSSVVREQPSDIVFSSVKSVDRSFTTYGYVVDTVRCDDFEVTVPCTETVKYNVQKGSVIAVDDSHVVFCSDKNNLAKRVSREFRCPYCDSVVNIPLSGYVQCSYENCVSRMYPSVVKFCHELELPSPSYDEYKEAVDNKKFMSMCDVFDLPTLSGVGEVTCSAASLVRALCPTHVMVPNDFFDKFAESAGSVDALLYYVSNPDKICQDLVPPLSRRSSTVFSSWLSSPENVVVVQQFFDLSNIHVVRDTVVLDVPKLFRNKRVYVEGRFKYGSYSEICSILRSYGAEVASKFDNRCNCVVVGKLTQNVESLPSVVLANSYKIPVFDEVSFFSEYGIDKDLASANVHL